MGVWYPDRLALCVVGNMPKKFRHDGLAVYSDILQGLVDMCWLLGGFDLDHLGAPFRRFRRFVAVVAEALCISDISKSTNPDPLTRLPNYSSDGIYGIGSKGWCVPVFGGNGSPVWEISIDDFGPPSAINLDRFSQNLVLQE